jgi:hypothetical protein
MVYKFRLITDESDDFFRDFEIKADQTFYDLHLAIQNEFDYDQSQVASFFITDDKWRKKQEITLFDPAEEDDKKKSKVLVMDMVKLSEFVSDKKSKLLYVFDIFSDRAFYIELAEIKKENKGTSYPMVADGNGDAPQQIIMEDKKFNKTDNYEFDEFTTEDEDFEEEDINEDEDFDPSTTEIGLDDDLGLGDEDLYDDEFGGGYDTYDDYR